MEVDAEQDYRLLWIREKVLTFMNEDDPLLFHELLERDGQRVDELLNSYLDEDLFGVQDLEKKVFFIYKTYYDKIVEEEILVAEEVLPEEPVKEPTPPPSPKKKARGGGQKGKAKKEKLKAASPPEGAQEGEEGDAIGEQDVPATEPQEGSPEPPAQEPQAIQAPAPAAAPPPPEETPSPQSPAPVEEVKKKKGKGGKKSEKESPITLVEELQPVVHEPKYVYVKKIIEKVIKAPELHAHLDRKSVV